jgi:hydrogenase-4 component B
MDGLAAFFLVPVFLMGGLGAVYGLGTARDTGRRDLLPLYWGLLVAGMVLLLLAGQAVLFLFGWECMALAGFFLIGSGHERPDARHASWLYLAATHVATLALLALFALWEQVTGSMDLLPVNAGILDPGAALALFLLALLAFGIKAGLAPFQFWLPPAHAAAPTHVSAMLSGVVIKMGVYGMLRVLSLLPPAPPAWGGLLLLLGVASAVLGVIQALGQHDLKRLLAWHSVENIGIIFMGLGLAMLGRSLQHPTWVVLGLGGCLLHVWNHGLFKPLLFMGAGAVVYRTGTREIDRLGGLAHPMPWTAALFLLGAVAICGLPPLNGLASELLVFLGLMQGITNHGEGTAAIALAAPALALVGALALACFIKVYGAVFLGTPRTGLSAPKGEVGPAMRAPMLVLAALCLAIGVYPVGVAPLLDHAIAAWMPAPARTLPPLAGLAPLAPLGQLALLLVGTALLIGVMMKRKRARAVVSPTWDCGYALPTPRMQTSASSLARPLILLFSGILRPGRMGQEVHGLFPAGSSLHTEVRDGVLDRVILPVVHELDRRLGWFHRFQQGMTQHYVLYIVIVLILLLSTLLSLEPLGRGWHFPLQWR